MLNLCRQILNKFRDISVYIRVNQQRIPCIQLSFNIIATFTPTYILLS
jgi:hypothetical protein